MVIHWPQQPHVQFTQRANERNSVGDISFTNRSVQYEHINILSVTQFRHGSCQECLWTATFHGRTQPPFGVNPPLLLPSPPFLVLPFIPQQVQLWGLESSGVRGEVLAAKAFLVHFKPKKYLWQLFWFFSWPIWQRCRSTKITTSLWKRSLTKRDRDRRATWTLSLNYRWLLPHSRHWALVT